MPFHEVDTSVIAADRTEGRAGTFSIEQWRQEVHDFYALRRESMARLFGEPGWNIRPEEPLAVIWFRPV